MEMRFNLAPAGKDIRPGVFLVGAGATFFGRRLDVERSETTYPTEDRGSWLCLCGGNVAGELVVAVADLTQLPAYVDVVCAHCNRSLRFRVVWHPCLVRAVELIFAQPGGGEEVPSAEEGSDG